MKFCSFLAPISCSLLLSGGAAAAAASQNSGKDTTLCEDPGGGQSSGASTFLMTGRVGTNDASPRRRGLLQFNLSGIPAGATSNSGQLMIQLIKVKNNNSTAATLQRVMGAGTEGTTNAGTTGNETTANPGDATWLHRISPPPWTNLGGDFPGTASSTLNVGSPGTYTWSGSGLVTDVRFWLGNAPQNFGWIMRGHEVTPQSVKEFSSRESAADPVLLINFTPVPEPSSVPLLLAVIGLAVRHRYV